MSHSQELGSRTKEVEWLHVVTHQTQSTQRLRPALGSGDRAVAKTHTSPTSALAFPGGKTHQTNKNQEISENNNQSAEN